MKSCPVFFPPSARVRLAGRMVTVRVDARGRISFEGPALPAVAALPRVEAIHSAWARACRGDKRALRVLPRRLRSAAETQAAVVAQLRKLGRGATYSPSPFQRRAAARSAGHIVPLCLGLINTQTTGGTDVSYDVGPPRVVSEYGTCRPEDAEGVRHPKAYSRRGYRCHTCEVEVRLPVAKALRATRRGTAVVVPGVGEIRRSRGTGLALWVQGPRGGWRLA